MKRVGLLAGYGNYPVLLAKELKHIGYKVYCLRAGDQKKEIAEYCEVLRFMRFGQFGKAVRFFKKHDITHATLAGGIVKRQFHRSWPLLIWRYLPDWYTVRMFAPHFVFRTKDCTVDSMLLTCVEAFERHGIKLLPGTDFAPELLVKREQMTKIGPTTAQWKDIQFGWNIAKEMGRLDIGQTITVKDQSVVAIEALEGTDECILRSGHLCKGFTVIKVAKPKQDMRFDLPCFGKQTIENIVKAGGKVLAIEANRAIFIGHDDVIDYANRNGIAIVGLLEEDINTSRDL